MLKLKFTKDIKLFTQALQNSKGIILCKSYTKIIIDRGRKNK